MNEPKKKAPPPPLRHKLNLNAIDNPLSMAGVEKNQINAVLELKLDDIQEDKSQPRTVFNQDALQSLADSIKTRGVQQPIAVRPKNSEGKYTVIQGARRFRASGLAGKTTIPAIIQSDQLLFNDYAQVVENIQRENLSPFDIANFIQKRQEAGDSDITIASGLGESRQYIARHSALFEAPQDLLNAFEIGRISGIGVFYEFLMLWKNNPEAAENLLEGDAGITLSMVRSAKNPTKEKPISPQTQTVPETVFSEEAENTGTDSNDPTTELTEAAHDTDDSEPANKNADNENETAETEEAQETQEDASLNSDAIEKSEVDDDEGVEKKEGADNLTPIVLDLTDFQENPTVEPIELDLTDFQENSVVELESEAETEPRVITGAYHGRDPAPLPPSPPDPAKIKKPLLFGTHNGEPIKLLLQQRPTTPGFVHVQHVETMIDSEIPIGEIVLTELSEMLLPEKG